MPQQNSQATHSIPTACPADCPDACAILADRCDGALRLRPNPAMPLTGFLCGKALGYPERLAGAQRLRRPLWRRNGRLVPVSWEAALDEWAARTADAVGRHGPPAVMFLQGAGSMYFSKQLIQGVFAALGGYTTTMGSLCGAAGNLGLEQVFGRPPLCTPEEVRDHSRGVLLWGRNAWTTNSHLVPILRQVRARGGSVGVVELRETATTRQADRVWSVAPGGDAFLAALCCKWLVEEGSDALTLPGARRSGAFVRLLRETPEAWLLQRSGTPRRQAEGLYHWLTAHRPVFHFVGYGPQRYLHGHLQSQWVAALSILLGGFAARGGGVQLGKDEMAMLPLRFRAPPPQRRRFPVAAWQERIARAEPPVEVLVVTGTDPAKQGPDSRRVRQALARTFTVALDITRTATTDRADLVLPVASFLEEGPDWRGSYWHSYLLRSRQAAEPPGESRPELAVFSDLGRRLGLHADPVADMAALDRHLLASPLLTRCGDGVYKWDEEPPHLAGGDTFFLPTELPGLAHRSNRTPECFDKTIAAPSETAEPVADAAQPKTETAQGRTETDRQPADTLRLVSYHVADYLNGQRYHLSLPTPPLSIHPDEAARLGLAEGRRALLTPPGTPPPVEAGSGPPPPVVRITLDSSLGRGYCMVPAGWEGLNDLAPGLVSPGYGAPFHETVVAIRPVEEAR